MLRLTEMGDGSHDPARLRAGAAAEADLQFRSGHRRERQARTAPADLEEVAASGRKAIVFSQWVGTLRSWPSGWRAFHPLEYHGQVPHAKRDAVIAEFRDDPHRHVLLISYGAGGVGLNLQFAGYVFLFDRWWNPAVEDQAINRAHRIGAAGPVTVTPF